jgi:hypothetical protein
MAQVWRWDQGRLAYFNYDNIRRIAPVLVELNGLDLSLRDPLRGLLDSRTGLPFAVPETHTIWRNYGRIFKCELLATGVDRHLVVTDLCRRVAVDGEDAWDVDDYMAFMIPRFYYPSPALQGYDTTTPQVFPFCVLIRYLLAQHLRGNEAHISLEQVFSLLINNECLGFEADDYYLNLKQRGSEPQDDGRQVRELLNFISQCSFLKWYNNTLYLDVLPGDYEALTKLREICTPQPKQRNPNANGEILALGTLTGMESPFNVSVIRELPFDITFTEGKRVRVTHLRAERSPKLRKLFFDSLPPPVLCDMCMSDLIYRYPWTVNLLEVHHLLPLASVIAFEGIETSFTDLVPLCPNCHRSVHVYYLTWLKDRSLEDFSTAVDAKNAYQTAKSLIRLN